MLLKRWSKATSKRPRLAQILFKKAKKFFEKEVTSNFWENFQFWTILRDKFLIRRNFLTVNNAQSRRAENIFSKIFFARAGSAILNRRLFEFHLSLYLIRTHCLSFILSLINTVCLCLSLLTLGLSLSYKYSVSFSSLCLSIISNVCFFVSLSFLITFCLSLSLSLSLLLTLGLSLS